MSSGGAGWPPGGADDDLGADGQYVDPAGYDWSEPSGRSRDQGDFGRRSGRHSALSPYSGDGYSGDGYSGDGYSGDGYSGERYSGERYSGEGADSGQFRDRGGYGGAGYGGAGYGDPNYGYEGHGSDHGQGWPAGGPYAGDQFAPGSYDQDPGGGWYGQGPASGSYSEPGYEGYDVAGRDRDGYGSGDYGRGSYGPEQYDRDGQPGYGGDYYGRAPYRGDGYGQDGPSSDSYRRDTYAQEGYGSGDGYRSTDSLSSPDGLSSRDTGSFDSRDSGWSNRPDTGSFGASQEYPHDSQASRYGLPAGTVRRAELGGSTTGDPWPDASDDANGWHGDEPPPHEDDWQDDRADGGLLSRRFSGGGGDGGRGSSRRAGRVRRQRRLRGKFAFIAAILAGALVLGAVADYGYERFRAWHTTRYGNYPGPGYGRVHFNVPSGAALSALGPALMKAGVIMELRPYDSAAAAAPNASHLQPGIYLLRHHMSSAEAVQWLLSTKHLINDQLTIIEGLRAVAIAQILSKQTGLPVSQFTTIIDHPPASLGLPSWSTGKTAEGFLFPDTYRLAPGMTALQILRMMVAEFKSQVAGINLVAGAHQVFTTPWHVLIVASLVQAEAGSPKDFGKIARVAWHRLSLGMKLQFDSSTFYAMGKYGTYVSTPQEKNFPSPYNTYLHTGLPPGPIGNPGIAAIKAALHPPHGPWLYFITDTRHKPYVTHFTASYSQFQTWQQEFQG